MTTQQPDRLITVHDLEHPRSVTRSIKACLTLAGAAAAGVFALAATSPAANADTVDIPTFRLPLTANRSIQNHSVYRPFTRAGDAFERTGLHRFAGLHFQRPATDPGTFTSDLCNVDAYGFNGPINPTLSH